MDIIGTGLSGLVGSRVTELLNSEYSFTDLSKETGIDLLDFSKVREMITLSPSPWIFHFAAFTDVQQAEKEKNKGKESVSWAVNVLATEHIVNVCKDTGKSLLFISTDYVFDGTKDEYSETDIPNPISWYGKTKYEGELRVQALKEKSLIIRITNPYRANPVGKTDFVHKMLDRMKNGLEIQAPSDQIFCPTFIDDVALAIKKLLARNAGGIYHVVSQKEITPYEAAGVVAKEYGYIGVQIKPITYNQYFSGKALPPKRAHLKHDKIDSLEMKLHTFEDGVHEVNLEEKKRECI